MPPICRSEPWQRLPPLPPTAKVGHKLTTGRDKDRCHAGCDVTRHSHNSLKLLFHGSPAPGSHLWLLCPPTRQIKSRPARHNPPAGAEEPRLVSFTDYLFFYRPGFRDAARRPASTAAPQPPDALEIQSRLIQRTKRQRRGARTSLQANRIHHATGRLIFNSGN